LAASGLGCGELGSCAHGGLLEIAPPGGRPGLRAGLAGVVVIELLLSALCDSAEDADVAIAHEGFL
jgi:hypothetical protein